MSIADTAARAARELRDALEPWATPETRRLRLDEWRTALARQIAETETGVTFAEARLLSVYSRRDLTAHLVTNARRYQDALLAAYHRLPTDYLELLQWAERHAETTVAVPA